MASDAICCDGFSVFLTDPIYTIREMYIRGLKLEVCEGPVFCCTTYQIWWSFSKFLES